MKRFVFPVLATLAVVALLGAAALRRAATQAVPTAQMAVVATFYPLAEFARRVGGEDVAVRTLVPPGAEPHDWEPTPGDLVAMQRARVFVYNGAGFETWVDNVLPDLRRAGVIILDASQGLPLLARADEANARAGRGDPHFWLDPVLAQEIVKRLAETLGQADPAHAGRYRERAAAYVRQLDNLDAAYRSGLKDCRRRTIIAAHAAFAYLAQRYDLQALSIQGLSPDVEPSPEDLRRLAEQARQRDIHYVFFERLVSPRLAEVLAKEVGAQTLVFDPLEGLSDEEMAAGKDYLSVMKDNLANLRIALDCA